MTATTAETAAAQPRGNKPVHEISDGLLRAANSPVLRQIVTWRTPRRILCAGVFDMGFLLRLSFRPDHRGLTAPLPDRPQTGRSERQRPGKLKIGGDLQGEPIFSLPGPSAG